MPRELCLFSTESYGFRTAPHTPLDAGEVRVQTRYSRIQHGLDALWAGGRPAASSARYPLPLWTWSVGKVVAAGGKGGRFAEGDWVYGPMLHADYQVCAQNRLKPLEWIKPEFSVFTGAGVVALNCVRQAGIRYGDRVAIWGMGTLGLMALQYVLGSGARDVIAVDPLLSRLEVARRLGAAAVYVSIQEWVGERTAFIGQDSGIDVGLDLSGCETSLREAAGAVKRGGVLSTGAALSYQPAVIQSIRDQCAARSVQFLLPEPREDDPRLLDMVEHSLAAKRVIVWPIISHRIPFDQAPSVYKKIQSDPGTYIQVLLTYENENA
ncbi:MAG: zinc-binding alcohol dehydrogenase [bacterium]